MTQVSESMFALPRASWMRAMESRERAAAGLSPHADGGAGTAWVELSAFRSPAAAARRLAVDGLSVDDISALLAIDPARTDIPVPPWVDDLERMFACAPAFEARTSGDEATAGLLNLVRPAVGWALEQIAAARLRAPISQRAPVFSTVGGVLADRLGRLVGRTLILELNVSRLEGRLAGDDPASRFRSFVDGLRDAERARAIFEEYPVMARRVVAESHRVVDVVLEFTERLGRDWEEITRTFGIDPNDTLASIHLSAGDVHHGGRAVMIPQLASGRRFVYKPHSLSVDVKFQSLLGWLNGRGWTPPFRQVQLIDRGDYGWVEFVEHGTCASAEGLQRFYLRQGGFLALLHVLAATDFHAENLIAAGEDPVMVDLEALFHPVVRGVVRAGDGLELLASTVLRVGMLPQKFAAKLDYQGFEFSGLGGAEGQFSPEPVSAWADAGSDVMRVVKKRVQVPAQRNRPRLEGHDVSVLDYVDDLVTGFQRMYDLLAAHRDALLAPDGPISAFADAHVRVIVRATRIYGSLLQDCAHPDVLRDAMDRDCLINQVWQGFEHIHNSDEIHRSEADDLRDGDIPLFATRPGSRDLWNSRGERIAEVLQETGLDVVARRLGDLSAGDRERQSLLIRASMTTLSRNVRPERPAEWSTGPRDVLALPVEPPTEQQLIDAARRVGDRLLTLAIGDVHWIGLSLQHDHTWVLSPIGTELYAGTTGIAMFLAVLGHVTGERRYRERAEMVVETVVTRGAPTSIMNVGAFGGAAGRAYAFLVMGQLWDRQDLIDRAETILVEADERIEKDIEFDVISGSAGLLHVLCAFLEIRDSAPIRRVAERCGEYLMSRAIVQESGVAWTPTQKSEGPLAGQSHGVAGISWALTRLFAITGDDRLRETALRGVAYEQSLFKASHQNWPDLRLLDGEDVAGPEPRFGWTWCHGAPGIGLSRFAMSATLKSPELLDQAVVALHSTSRFGLGNGHGHCLCHGDLGNLEIHLGASERLGDPRWERIRVARLGGIVSEIAERGYACGVPNGAETPGLLTGLAGIGYGLLRQAQPAVVPSLLALEPFRPQPPA